MRVVRGEELRHRTALRHAEDVRALPTRRVHHGEDVLDPLLECRHLIESIRQAHAAFVELNARHIFAHVLERAAIEFVLPADLDVRYEGGNDDQRRAFAPHLVGDADLADAGVARFRYLHGLS